MTKYIIKVIEWSDAVFNEEMEIELYAENDNSLEELPDMADVMAYEIISREVR